MNSSISADVAIVSQFVSTGQKPLRAKSNRIENFWQEVESSEQLSGSTPLWITILEAHIIQVVRHKFKKYSFVLNAALVRSTTEIQYLKCHLI